jgi:hypothetical protein
MHIHSVKTSELSIYALQADILDTIVGVNVAVCGFSLCTRRRNYLRGKCRLEETAV